MCLAAASYALAASSAVSNVPSHNRAPRFGSRISAAQLFVVCLSMSALLLIRKSYIFVVSLVKEILPPSKKRKISPKKREKKEVFFAPSPRPLPYAPVHRGTLFLGLCFGRPALLGGSTAAAAVQGGRVFLGVLF